MSREGFWAVELRGADDTGLGIIVFDTGMVVGVDTGGMTYDGTYTADPATGDLLCEVRCTATQPDAVLVQTGRPIPLGAAFDVRARLPRTLGERRPIPVQTPFGPVVAVFTKIRDFPN